MVEDAVVLICSYATEDAIKNIHKWIMDSHYEIMDILNCELLIIELWIWKKKNIYVSIYMYHNWRVYFYIIVSWMSTVKHFKLWKPKIEL